MKQKNIGVNSVFSLLKSFSTVIFPLVTFPYISRVLQPENVGKVNFSSSVVSYFVLIASLGINTYAIRECSKYKASKIDLEKNASEIISINLVTTIISYILLIGTILLLPRLRNYTLIICILSSQIIFITLGADWLNTVMEDFAYITIRTFIMQLLAILCMFSLIHSEGDYVKYAFITVLSTSGANAINIIYRRRFCKLKITKNLNLKKHLKPIIALFAMLVAQHIFVTSDTLIIGLKLGDYSVGLYSTAIKAYNLINQVVASVTWVVMPQLSISFSNNDYHNGQRILNYAFKFISILGFPCAVLLFFLNKEAVYFIGGESYIGANTVMRILAFTLFFSLLACFFLNICILASGKDNVALAACFIPAFFNLAANYVTVPIWGIEAAAWTTVISQIIILLICIPFVPRKYGISHIIQKGWKVAFALIGLSIICLISKMLVNGIVFRIVLCIGIGGIFYIVILLILKEEFVIETVSKIKTLFIKGESK